MMILPSILISRNATLRKKNGPSSLLSEYVKSSAGDAAQEVQQSGSKRSSPQTPDRPLERSTKRRLYSEAGVVGSLNPSAIPSSPFTGSRQKIDLAAQSYDPLCNPLAGGWASTATIQRASDFSGPAVAAAQPLAFACPGIMQSLMDSDAGLCGLAVSMGQQQGRDASSSPGEGSLGRLSDDGGSVDTLVTRLPEEATGAVSWSQLLEEASGQLAYPSSSIHADWDAMVESLPNGSLLTQASEDWDFVELCMSIIPEDIPLSESHL